MVRLFINEGEGQSAITHRDPKGYPAQPDLIASPWRSCVAAAGFTALRAVVGRAVPGTFVKATAYFGLVDLSFTALGMYGRRDLNRALFKMEKVEPKSGRLWERTKHWTVEDTTFLGGLGGLSVGQWFPRFPGRHSWTRPLGLAIVGAACGSWVGQRLLVKLPLGGLQIINSGTRLKRVAQYNQLAQNAEMRASLSYLGRLTLLFYQLQGLRIASMHAVMNPETAHGALRSEIVQRSPDSTTFHIEFEKDELDGPDIEQGHRTYRDDLTGRDASTLKDRLDHLCELKNELVIEAQYIWQELAKKEDIFYGIAEDGEEKELYRRELQLLNSIAIHLLGSVAILTYHIADAHKQLGQINQNQALITGPILSDSLQSDVSVGDVHQHSPQLATSRVRKVWESQKEVLAQLEQLESRFDTDESAPSNPNLNMVRENIQQLTRNLEATSRLLREFEEQVRKAEAQTRT